MKDYTKSAIFDYTKNLRWARLRVGILLSAALVIIFLAVIFASNIGSLFEHATIIYSDFSDVKGLKTGAPVRLSGVQIGTVQGIHFKRAQDVKVAMSIKEDYLQHITTDSTATVNSMGILGDKYIELIAGRDGKIAPGGVIAGATPLDIQNLAGSSNAVIAKLGGVVERLDHILDRIENGNGTAAKLIRDPSLYDNLNSSTKSLSSILDTLKNSNGSLKKFVVDKSLYDNLDVSSRRLSSILDRIDKGKGTVGRLTTDERLSRELEQTASALRALVEDIKKNPKKYLKISVF